MTVLGSGHKTFVAQTVLHASEVQEYLMDQSVMVFADSATRSSSHGSPGEGQVSYLVDTKVLQVHKPTVGWVTIGLQSEIRDAQIMTYMQVV